MVAGYALDRTRLPVRMPCPPQLPTMVTRGMLWQHVTEPRSDEARTASKPHRHIRCEKAIRAQRTAPAYLHNESIADWLRKPGIPLEGRPQTSLPAYVGPAHVQRACNKLLRGGARCGGDRLACREPACRRPVQTVVLSPVWLLCRLDLRP